MVAIYAGLADLARIRSDDDARELLLSRAQSKTGCEQGRSSNEAHLQGLPCNWQFQRQNGLERQAYFAENGTKNCFVSRETKVEPCVHLYAICTTGIE
jgi:hypothetical protein